MTRERKLRIERREDIYSAYDGDRLLWQLALGPIALETTGVELAASTFLEELVWPAAGVAVIGAGDAVYFVGLASGTVSKHIRLGADQFGHLTIDPDPYETDADTHAPAADLEDSRLYVLGWQRVVAVGRDLDVRWISDEIAVDGITWGERRGDRMRVSAEMDPPGTWIDVELDVETGAELSRGDSLSSN